MILLVDRRPVRKGGSCSGGGHLTVDIVIKKSEMRGPESTCSDWFSSSIARYSSLLTSECTESRIC